MLTSRFAIGKKEYSFLLTSVKLIIIFES